MVHEQLDGNTEKSEIRSKIDETLGLLNLTDQKNVKIKGISKRASIFSLDQLKTLQLIADFN